MKKATEVAFPSAQSEVRTGCGTGNQLRVWSTSLFLAIHGIIARN